MDHLRHGAHLMSRVAQQALLGASAAAAATLTYQTITTHPTEGQTVTFTGAAIGTASSDRRVFVVIPYYNGGSSNISIASVTIAGTLATIHCQAFEVGTYRGGCAIVSAAVPTGTTADIVVTFASSGGGYYRPRIAVYRVTGLQSAVAQDTVTETGGAYAYPRAKNINVVKDGIVLVGCCMYGDALPLTLSGVDQDYVVTVLSGGLVYIGGSDTTPTTKSQAVTIGGLSSGNPGLVMASFR